MVFLQILSSVNCSVFSLRQSHITIYISKYGPNSQQLLALDRLNNYVMIFCRPSQHSQVSCLLVSLRDALRLICNPLQHVNSGYSALHVVATSILQYGVYKIYDVTIQLQLRTQVHSCCVPVDHSYLCILLDGLLTACVLQLRN